MESGEGEEVNIEELAANLTTYKDQLQQVLPFYFFILFFFCACVELVYLLIMRGRIKSFYYQFGMNLGFV